MTAIFSFCFVFCSVLWNLNRKYYYLLGLTSHVSLPHFLKIILSVFYLFDVNTLI